jgi:hypothetical protein
VGQLVDFKIDLSSITLDFINFKPSLGQFSIGIWQTLNNTNKLSVASGSMHYSTIQCPMGKKKLDFLYCTFTMINIICYIYVTLFSNEKSNVMVKILLIDQRS